jgi:hypothetical protein
MRNFLRSIFTRASKALIPFVAGLGIGSLVIGPAALALVFPGQYAPRYFPTQQTHYERHVVNITAGSVATASVATVDTAQNTCIFTTTTACSVRIGAVPYNAFLVRAYVQITTACNGTLCTIGLGTASASQNIFAAQVFTAATFLTPALANPGITVTGNNIASSGADGGFDLYLTFSETAQSTAGTAVVVLEYIGSNDGGCVTNVSFPTLANTVGPC